ncbi:MAG: succinate--CoA ligase subunit alpha [Candidatus Methanomethylicia archaeon]
MPIIVDRNTILLVQGITGREGSYHTEAMLKYGTRIVAGVTPGKGGMKVSGVPVYNAVKDAVNSYPDINTSIIFVPAAFACDSVYEAIDAGIKRIAIITEGLPIHDEIRLINYARLKNVIILGPNCPGVISPGEMVKVGIMPERAFKPGNIGIVSRSGTLTYEISEALSVAGFGQSTVLGIGGDPITGLDFIDVVDMFFNDPETKGIVVVGEIGGDAEERLASHIKFTGLKKPIISFIAGKTAPPGKRMGHAGAIITMGMGSAESKVKALESVGIPVALTPMQIVELARSIFK